MQTITLHLGYSIRIMIYNAFAVKLKGSITNVLQSFCELAYNYNGTFAYLQNGHWKKKKHIYSILQLGAKKNFQYIF